MLGVLLLEYSQFPHASFIYALLTAKPFFKIKLEFKKEEGIMGGGVGQIRYCKKVVHARTPDIPH
jgi:hypothetical protein